MDPGTARARETGTVRLRGFGWRHAGRRAWALRDLDLHLAPGERVLLLGPSGVGKSTLLAALAGLLPEDSGEQAGEITVNGAAPRAARDQTGLLYQDPQSQLVMARCGDDVAFGLENRGVAAALIWPRVAEALATVGFPYPVTHRTDALSGGEQQRLALAGVLALRPGLLLLDEPTANLDPDGATLVRTAVGRALTERATMGEPATMILVEHRVAESLPLVDRVVALAPGGGLLADGDPATVFAEHGDELAGHGVWVPGRAIPAHRATGPPGEDLLHTTGLGYRHPGASRWALRETDIRVRAGEALAVLGPNGSGKSTLALLLGGLLAPTTGRVAASPALAGRDADTEPHRWPAPALARRIGSVFQNPEHQFLTSRVRDELALGPRRAGHSPADVSSTVDALLARLHLDRLAEANPYTLSGGEQRRLSVATALAAAPRVLVLDEPTFGQDRRTWVEVVGLLAGLRDEGRAVLTVTHDPDLVEALADRVHRLAAGPSDGSR